MALYRVQGNGKAPAGLQAGDEVVTGGQATLTFDDTVSAKFPKGAYFYDILYTHGDKTTLARDNRAAAE